MKPPLSSELWRRSQAPTAQGLHDAPAGRRTPAKRPHPFTETSPQTRRRPDPPLDSGGARRGDLPRPASDRYRQPAAARLRKRTGVEPALPPSPADALTPKPAEPAAALGVGARGGAGRKSHPVFLGVHHLRGAA